MSPTTTYILFFTLLLPHLFLLPPTLHNRKSFAAAAGDEAAAVGGGGGGKWDLLLPSIGIVAMHMQLLHNDKVVIYDRTDFGLSNISLPRGKCRRNLKEVLKEDCTAHSVEYDVVSNSVRPLMVLTDVWCSSGSVFSDGSLVQTGGFKMGQLAVRIFNPCNDAAKCDWREIPAGLSEHRWYATNHILPNGRQIIIGGRRAFNYEFYPKNPGGWDGKYHLPFLVQTDEPGIENNLYPFVFLNVDGHLFIFANNRAILFDYGKNVVVRTYPQMPDGHPRCYPSTGSGVLLPLKNLNGPTTKAEVLVCGGSPTGGFRNAKNHRNFVDALRTCGRITITEPNPNWRMEEMPLPRVMGDMVTLPNGHVLIINGAGAGAAGWDLARNPVFNPVLYRPDDPTGSRFEVQNPNKIPRMYHSTAILIRDGRVLISGSNPHKQYNFTNVLFPTELSLESFSPSYLDPKYGNLRPQIVSPASQVNLRYGTSVSVQFKVSGPVLDKNLIKVTMISPSFCTHSFSMNQRLLVLNSGEVKSTGGETYQIDVVAPDSGNLAPSGYYLLFVVHQNIPSNGIWVHIQ